MEHATWPIRIIGRSGDSDIVDATGFEIPKELSASERDGLEGTSELGSNVACRTLSAEVCVELMLNVLELVWEWLLVRDDPELDESVLNAEEPSIVADGGIPETGIPGGIATGQKDHDVWFWSQYRSSSNLRNPIARRFETQSATASSSYFPSRIHAADSETPG